MNENNNKIREYAFKHYNNQFCLSKEEFERDLRYVAIIKRTLTNINKSKRSYNIKLLINNTIAYYNVFEHNPASLILKMRLSENQYAKMNSILVHLGYPTLPNYSFYDDKFYDIILEESDYV